MNGNMKEYNQQEFNVILSIIEKARENTFRSIIRELISMYWDIGKHISEKAETIGWGKTVVKEFSDFIQNRYIGIQGFSASNI
jgi:hypothetical protein